MNVGEKSFEDVKTRLNEIADEVAREGVSLDDALALYEEAVGLGLAACDLSELDVTLLADEKAQAADTDAATAHKDDVHASVEAAVQAESNTDAVFSHESSL